MDTVFKIINKDKITYIGASNFGYENLLIKSLMKLINIIEDSSNLDSYTFLKSHFVQFDGSKEQDLEAFIDVQKRIIEVDPILDIKEVKNAKSIKKVNFEGVNVLLKRVYSFDEFKILYRFYYDYSSLKEILINEKYLLTFHYKNI